jgi:hypothetical protein
MTIDEAGSQIEAAIMKYGPAAVAIIERVLAQVRSEIGSNPLRREYINKRFDPLENKRERPKGCAGEKTI